MKERNKDVLLVLLIAAIIFISILPLPSSASVKVSPPKDLTVTAVNSSEIHLRWSEVPNATSYNVYRAESEEGVYTKIFELTGTKFYNLSLSPSTTYWYKVQSEKRGIEGGLSNPISATTNSIISITDPPKVQFQGAQLAVPRPFLPQLSMAQPPVESIPTPPQIDEGRGNSVGNIVNGGLQAAKGDWIYYTNYSDRNTLYKIKNDGSNKIKVSNDSAWCINVVGDWIYYSNKSDEYKLYKIRTDGGSRMKLSDNKSRYINVVDNWIYYSNYDDDYKIYKIKTDGSDRTKLNEDWSWYINVVDDWIYYSNYDDEHHLYKIKIDGSSRTQLNDDISENINVVGNYVYYLNGDDLTYGGYLYKINTDGSNRMKLNDDWIYEINVAGDWIYYSNKSDNDKLYKIKIDGESKTKVIDDPSWYINVEEDWISYLIWGEEDKNYKIKPDGMEKQIIN